MSTTPTADLRAHAHARGVSLTRQGAQKLLARLGPKGAEERVDAIGALQDLASAFGIELSSLAAARRLDAAGGGFDAARGRLIDRIAARRTRDFNRLWAEFELQHYASDAHERHAAFLAELQTGSLGQRAMMLVLAAADADLRAPDAKVYRQRLTRIVSLEFDRRNPARPEGEWDLIPEDPIERDAWEQERARYKAHVQPAIDSEQQARSLAERHILDDDGKRDLAIALNRFADDPAFRGDVERVLAEIRRRLGEALQRADAGAWRPDPEEYRRNVVEAAADATWAA
jgi:hypothetical protein